MLGYFLTQKANNSTSKTKVGLKKGFLDMNSTDNNVDKNIAVMQGSD